MVNALTIQKRDGGIEEFSAKKLAASIQKALVAAQAKKQDAAAAANLAEKVQVQVVRLFSSITPRTIDVHDITVETLKKAGQVKAAAAYEKQRAQRFASQKFRTVLGVRDDLMLTHRAVATLAHLYLMRNEQGQVIETPGQMCRRVAKAIVQAEQPGAAAKKLEEQFYEVLASRHFLPSSTVLQNAGINNKMLANVMLPIQDSIDSIFASLNQMVQLLRHGTVVTISLDALRPRNTLIKGTKGYSTGPVSFLRLFDAAADTISEANRRKVANMAVLRIDHPDIEEFIAVELRNFKKGVLLTDAFMRAAVEDKEWPLLDANKRESKRVRAAALCDAVLATVLAFGDPALIFVDEIGAERPLATTPCPSQPLYAYESCPQGVINLAAMVERNHIAWEKLRKTVQVAVRFLDDVLDVSVYPDPAIEQATKAKRKIGIGVMGYAEMLIQLGIQYGSKKALSETEKVMKFINDEAHKESAALGKAKGGLPGDAKKPMRNATLTTVALTGNLSLLGPATCGIEPVGAVVSVEHKVLDINPVFERMLREKGVYSPALICKVVKTGVAGAAEVPRDIKGLFTAAIPLDAHLRTQAAFQKSVDNGVCKALHVAGLKPLDLKKVVLLGHKMRLKGMAFHKDAADVCRGCGV